MKRLFDIVFSAVMLVGLSPILLICALAVKVTSQGPILFDARRIGRSGVPFRMFKFRTMAADGGGAVITGHADPRISPIGAVLRRLKLDELPQFVNVFVGDMSVVGPRPEDPKIVSQHYNDWMRETLRVRPGITSPGAVFYYVYAETLIDRDKPEESYVEKLLPAKLAVERAYLDRATFWSDLHIMFQTASAILAQIRGRAFDPDRTDIKGALHWVPKHAFEDILQ